MSTQQTHPNIPDAITELLGKNGIQGKSVKIITEALQPLNIGKGDCFCKKGSRADKLGVLIKGLLVAKYEKQDSGDEAISRFYYVPRNIIIASFESFYFDTKSNETIEALEDSYLFVITRDDLHNLYNEIPEMNKIGRQLAEQSYIQALQRIHQLQTMKSEERFKQFYKEHSEIVSKLQIQHLCSYIGVNRNTLARLSKTGKK